MTTRTPRRPGASLIEVLVAMFTMAAGMTALLTLFPLGAMQISQSLKDDRCAQTAAQADGLIRAYWRANLVQSGSDQVLPAAMTHPTNVNPGNPVSPVLLPPGAANGSTSSTQTLTPAYLTSPTVPTAAGMPQLGAAHVGQSSYPVHVDPLGSVARSSREKYWTAWQSNTTAATLLPRRSLGMFTLVPGPTPNYDFRPMSGTQALSFCSMPDDLTYDMNGEAQFDRPNPATFRPINVRQGRYNWSAVTQFVPPLHFNAVGNIDAKTTAAKLTILVFDGRPPSLAVPGDEYVVTTTLVAGNRDATLTVPIPAADSPPLLRRGGWIMDGSINSTTNVRNANFYRIVGLTEISSNATSVTYTVDLETPIKGPVAGSQQVYLFAGLAEVFERLPLAADNFPQP